jgi:hypothetical protein
MRRRLGGARPNDIYNIRVLSEIPRRVAEKCIYEQIKQTNLRRRSTEAPQTPDMRFRTNEEFWNKLLYTSMPSLRWVKLEGFKLIDWFPRSPGVYHTREAEEHRREARRFLARDEKGEVIYEPSGKMHMIEGGIGSLRFKPIKIDGIDFWLFTATSDGFCHSGVPVAIPDDLLSYTNISTDILYLIKGQVRYLPKFLDEHLWHMEGVPQVYVLVEQITELAEVEAPTYITPVVFFNATDDERRRGMYEYSEESKVSYVTCSADSYGVIDEASAWLERYVRRYSGTIITNFDETRPTFRNAPFSLQKVMAGTIDVNSVASLRIGRANLILRGVEQVNMEVAAMTNNNVNIGDGNSFQGDFVVAGSIANSFNKVESSNTNEDVKNVLKDLITAVGEMSKSLSPEKQKEVAQDLDVMTTEAVKEKPRKKWWSVSFEGLAEAAKDIGEVGKPVLEILAKLAPLIEKSIV